MITQTTSYPHWTAMYGEARAEDEWPKVYGSGNGSCFGVWFSNDDGYSIAGSDVSRCPFKLEVCNSTEDTSVLITDPTLHAKYVSAAEAFRARESDPFPHWWYREKAESVVCRVDSLTSGECWGSNGYHYVGTAKQDHTPEKMALHGFIRIQPPEAAALLAKWEADRKPPQPELPTAESVAENVVNQQCGIGRPAIADPDQTVRLSYVVGLIANAIHRDRRLRDKPGRRVKHDWTGAMGTVLMEHDGTSFVKWDDGQVTSVYNRHLQKELQ